MSATLPEILTAEEAARFLRLDLDRAPEAAVQALHRIEDQRGLVSVRYSRHRLYPLAELRRFIEEEAQERREQAARRRAEA